MNNGNLDKTAGILGDDFKNIFDNIADGILLAEPVSKKFLMGNPAICRMLGYTQEEIKSLGVSDIHPEKDLPYVLDQFEKQLKGEIKLSKDLPVKKKDGTILFADVNASSITVAGTSYLMGFFHDITERKKATEDLVRNNHQIELILRSVSEGILGLDVQGNHTFVNPVAAKMLGYEADELIGLPSHSVWHHTKADGSPYPKEECVIYDTLRSGAVHRSSTEVFWRKDGTSFPVAYTSTPTDEHGRLTGVVLTFVDITERRKAEETLLKSEKRYRSLFETSRDAIMTLEPPAWNFTVCNPATVGLFGAKDQEEFLSKAPWEVSPEFQPDGKVSSEKAKKMIQKAIDEGSNYFEWTHKRLDGSDFFATVLLTKVEIEKGKAFLQATVRDITEYKKAEEALKNSRDELEIRVKERTQALQKTNKEIENSQSALINVMEDLQLEKSKDEAILASIGDGMIATDKNVHVIVANEKIEKLVGWKRDEILGKQWFDLIPMEDEKGNPVPEDKRPIKQALNRGKATITTTGTYYFIRKDKTKFPVAVTATPIILNREIIGAIGVYRDITKELEIDRMKTEFMDIAAHDLRTPAAAIRGFISRVLDGDAGEISDKAKGFLKEAYEGNMRLIHLVDDFLTVSRLERGKVKITPKAGDLAEVIETSVRELSDIARSRGLKLEYAKDKLPAVLIDKDRTIEVLNNLIGNAIKFTQKGGITISNTINKVEVVTNVTDTGIGISSETQAHLFQKYYKGSEATTQSGLGLGLYISRLCIEGSGGKIWVKSKIGKGSTFSFSLPIAK